MRFLLLASLWAHCNFISAAPTDDLFALAPDTPGSNLDFQSFGDGSDSWDLGFKSGLDQNSNYLPDDSIFGSTNLASSITDASGADPNAFTSSDDLFGLDDPTDLIALEGSCPGTESSLPSDTLTARDTGASCQKPLNWDVPQLFKNPEDAITDTQPKVPDQQTPNPKPPRDGDEDKTIRQLLWEDVGRLIRGIGGDGVDCTPDAPSRCCTYTVVPSGLIDLPYKTVMQSCLASKISPLFPLSSCPQLQTRRHTIWKLVPPPLPPLFFLYFLLFAFYEDISNECCARSWCQGPMRGHV